MIKNSFQWIVTILLVLLSPVWMPIIAFLFVPAMSIRDLHDLVWGRNG